MAESWTLRLCLDPVMLPEFFHFDFALGLTILNGRGRDID